MHDERDPRVLAFRRLLAVVDRLRAPDGCPWDLDQTLSSMVPCLQEETAEVADAVAAEDPRAIAEELGDVLMNVLLMARIAEDERRFDLGGVCDGIAEKLIRRHPHVFRDQRRGTADEVLEQWERIKTEERGDGEDGPARRSVLDGVPAQWSALSRARKLVSRAARTGFAWPDERSALAKVEEELGELEQASAEGAEATERELGDVLFSSVAFAHRVRVDPDRALRRACDTFERRFRAMERLPGSTEGLSLEAWLDRWRRAKAATRSAGERT